MKIPSEMGSTCDFDNYAIFSRDLYFSYTEQFRKVDIIKGLAINIPKGSIYGLIGSSGCGKSTLLRCIFGYLRPQQGVLKIFGLSPGDPSLKIPGHNLGYAPQDECLTDDITAREMLTFCGRVNGLNSDRINHRIDELQNILDITKLGRLVRNLTGGQRRRLSLACALLHCPPLLLLDEPTVGSDPLLRSIIWSHLESLIVNQGTTVVVTSHYLEEVKDASLVGFMDSGQIALEDNPKTILRRYQVSSLEEVALIIAKKRQTFPSINTKVCETDNFEEIVLKETYEMLELTDTLSKPNFFDKIRSSIIIVMSLILRMFGRREFTLFYPMVISLLLNWYLSSVNYVSYGTDPIGLAVGYVSENTIDNLSYSLIQNIESRGLKTIHFDNEQLAKSSLIEASVQGYFIMKSDWQSEFRRRLKDNFKSTTDFSGAFLHYYGDEVNLIKSHYVKEVLNRAYNELTFKEASNLNVSSSLFNFWETEPVFGSQSKESIWTIREAFHFRYVLIILVGYSCATTLFWVPQDRQEKFFERLASAGISPKLTALSYICVALSIVVPCSQISLLLIRATENLFIAPGTVYIYHVVFALIAWSGFSVGLLIGSLPLASSKVMYGYIQAGYVMTSLWCSGVVSSVQSLPYFMSWFKYLFPISLAGDSLIQSMVKGLPISDPSVYTGLLFAFTHNMIYVVVFIFCLEY